MRPVAKSIKRCRRAWYAMLSRCQNPKNKDFARYTGKGIYVCPEWKTFEAFRSDMGDPPIGCTLERKDNDGPYSPANCKWATRKEQAINRSSTRWIEHDGVRKTQRQWARDLRINEATLNDRIRSGWSIAEALSKPASPNNSVLKKAASARRPRDSEGRFL